jgi:hypothetical protein
VRPRDVDVIHRILPPLMKWTGHDPPHLFPPAEVSSGTLHFKFTIRRIADQFRERRLAYEPVTEPRSEPHPPLRREGPPITRAVAVVVHSGRIIVGNDCKKTWE